MNVLESDVPCLERENNAEIKVMVSHPNVHFLQCRINAS
jgi:hypothetical protein